MSHLKDKVAVVTGASKGIGAAIAKRLSEAGAAVVVSYSSGKEDADRVVGNIKANGAKAIVSRNRDELAAFTLSAHKRTFDAISIILS